jgi:hypothetical protein
MPGHLFSGPGRDDLCHGTLLNSAEATHRPDYAAASAPFGGSSPNTLGTVVQPRAARILTRRRGVAAVSTVQVCGLMTTP